MANAMRDPLELGVNDELDFGAVWADWLYHEDDTIETSEWSVPPELIKGIDGLRDAETEDIQPKGVLVPNSEAYVWLSVAGTAVVGRFYRVVNSITTASSPSRKVSKALWIRVVE